MTRPLAIGGQRAWAHDEGHRAGTFHTFDALDVGTRFLARKVHVFLPRGYEHGERRFPTVYLHDGNTAFWRGGVAWQTWDVAGRLSELADRVQDVIVVAVHPVVRDAEYTHVDWAQGQRPWGQLPAHVDYLADEIVGFIDANYRTSKAPADRAIVGSSHGGLAAFFSATRRPDVFGKAGCLSPSFFSGLDSLVDGSVGEGTLRDSPLVDDVADLLDDASRRPWLWLCWGMRRDGGEHNAIVEALAAVRGLEMADLLVEEFGYEAGRELFITVDANGGHDEPAWRRRFGLMMQAFFPRELV